MFPGAPLIAPTPTLNIGTIDGGLKVNMITSYCIFEGDIRLPIGLSREDVLPVLEEILEKEYAGVDVKMWVQEAASNPAAGCAHDHTMVGIMARTAKVVMGQGRDGDMKKPVAISSLGADCNLYRYRGIPAYVFGVSRRGWWRRMSRLMFKSFWMVRTHALAAWEYLGGK